MLKRQTKQKIGGVLLGLVVLSLGFAGMAAVQISKQNGDRLQRKIDDITKNGATEPVPARRTPVSEDEINSYLAFNVKDKIPKGLADPRITIIGEGWLAGRVQVDLDEFKRHRSPQGFMDPLSYISGRVPVAARGMLRTRAGQGQFQLESAEILGLPLPKPILQELVSYFSRTPEQPNGFDMDAPFKLPSRIRELEISRGEVIVLQ